MHRVILKRTFQLIVRTRDLAHIAFLTAVSLELGHAMHKAMYNSRSGYCLTSLASNTVLLEEILHIYELSKTA